MVKKLCKLCRRHKRHGFDPWVGKIAWRRAWQPTPVFLTGESHGLRILADYSPWGHKESDATATTEHALYANRCYTMLYNNFGQNRKAQEPLRKVIFESTI